MVTATQIGGLELSNGELAAASIAVGLGWPSWLLSAAAPPDLDKVLENGRTSLLDRNLVRRREDHGMEMHSDLVRSLQSACRPELRIIASVVSSERVSGSLGLLRGEFAAIFERRTSETMILRVLARNEMLSGCLKSVGCGPDVRVDPNVHPVEFEHRDELPTNETEIAAWFSTNSARLEEKIGPITRSVLMMHLHPDSSRRLRAGTLVVLSTAAGWYVAEAVEPGVSNLTPVGHDDLIAKLSQALAGRS